MRRHTTGLVVGGAAAWAALFGSASLYVAAGGRTGGQLVAPALVTAVQHREPAVMGALWIAGILKLSSGCAVLLVHRFVGGRPRRLLGLACAALGAGLAAWGVAEGLTGALVTAGALAPHDGWGDGQVGWYYAFLWGPYWLTGGVLYVAAGRGLRATPRGQRDHGEQGRSSRTTSRACSCVQLGTREGNGRRQERRLHGDQLLATQSPARVGRALPRGRGGAGGAGPR